MFSSVLTFFLKAERFREGVEEEVPMLCSSSKLATSGDLHSELLHNKRSWTAYNTSLESSSRCFFILFSWLRLKKMSNSRQYSMYWERSHVRVLTHTRVPTRSTRTSSLPVSIACEPKVMCIIADEGWLAGKGEEKDEVMKSINTNISFNWKHKHKRVERNERKKTGKARNAGRKCVLAEFEWNNTRKKSWVSCWGNVLKVCLLFELKWFYLETFCIINNINKLILLD